MRKSIKDLLQKADQIGKDIQACLNEVQVFIAETELLLDDITVH